MPGYDPQKIDKNWTPWSDHFWITISERCLAYLRSMKILWSSSNTPYNYLLLYSPYSQTAFQNSWLWHPRTPDTGYSISAVPSPVWTQSHCIWIGNWTKVSCHLSTQYSPNECSPECRSILLWPSATIGWAAFGILLACRWCRCSFGAAYCIGVRSLSIRKDQCFRATNISRVRFSYEG
jgi:hypothetical protein